MLLDEERSLRRNKSSRRRGTSPARHIDHKIRPIPSPTSPPASVQWKDVKGCYATLLAGRAREKQDEKEERKELARGRGRPGQRNAKRRKDIGVYIEKRCCAVDRATVDLVS